MEKAAFGSVEDAVACLVGYGVRRGLIPCEEETYASNLLFDVMRYEPAASFVPGATERLDAPLEDVLAYLLDDAVRRGVTEDGIASRDLFDTRLMGCLTPRPGQVISTFWSLFEKSPQLATDYFYRLACDSDYIRTYRVARDRTWVTHTRYGDLDITINLSKPEKDPRAIAAALKRGADSYPRCLLCRESEGYAGRLDYPARQTIRLIPLELAGERWFMQYSPYVYYNEHCIVLSERHAPMRIDRMTFERLLEFVGMFPHYTIGSNADLPIVGGSILTHEHYQGGRYTFAMARADVRKKIEMPGFDDVDAGIVEWPMSVVRLRGGSPSRLVELADLILETWRGYSDQSAGILASTDGVPHNTITPIARRRGEEYELDLVLRNNRTSAEHPLGIFHPHEELHHIKKENIGLIEVMGLAVLPARLLSEMERLEQAIIAGEDISGVPGLAPHEPWARDILARHPELLPENVSPEGAEGVRAVIRDEIGLVFARVLEQCAVFPAGDEGSAAFDRFVASIA